MGPLHLAARSGSEAILKQLLDAKVRVTRVRVRITCRGRIRVGSISRQYSDAEVDLESMIFPNSLPVESIMDRRTLPFRMRVGRRLLISLW